MLADPLSFAALTCFFIGLFAAGVCRLVPLPRLGSVVPTLVFLTSYVLCYQQIPSFPPLGATNKVFYIVLGATLIGVMSDALRSGERAKRVCLVLIPLLSTLW